MCIRRRMVGSWFRACLGSEGCRADDCAGQYSVTAKVTVVVTAACSVVAAALFLLYNTVMLKLVKRKHEREIKAAERGEERGDGDV